MVFFFIEHDILFLASCCAFGH